MQSAVVSLLEGIAIGFALGLVIIGIEVARNRRAGGRTDPDLNRWSARISSTSAVLGARRRRGAARRLAALGSPAAMARLAEAFVHTADQQVADIARDALRAVREQAAIDAVTNVVIATGDEGLATVVTETGLEPSDPGRRAAVLFLAGDFDRYADLDFDGGLLRGVHAGAGESLRAKLAGKARAAGRLEWVRAIAGDRRAHLSEAEWDATVRVLENAQRWEELWRLALEAPAVWAARILRTAGDRRWRPDDISDRAAFADLVKRASRACAAGIPTTTEFGEEAEVIAASPAQIECMTVTPDGKLLISGGRNRDHTHMWHLPSGTRAGTLPAVAGHVTAMTTTPDGRLLITGNSAGGMRLWRLPSGTPAGEFDANDAGLRDRLTHLGRRLESLALTPDGSLLASGGHGRHVRLWRLSDGTLTYTASLPDIWTWAPARLAVTPDGATLVSGGGRESGVLRLWRLPDGALVRTLGRHGSDVSVMAITPDGTLLASGGLDKTVRLWHLPSGGLAGVLPKHTGQVRALAVTPDGRLLASAGRDSVVRLWHLPSGDPAGELPIGRSGLNGWVNCLAVSPDGLLLAGGTEGGEVRCWTRRPARLETVMNTPLGELTPGHIHRLERSSGEYSPDERAWFELVKALVWWRHRHDVELGDVMHNLAPAVRDIELVGDAPTPQRPARPKRKPRRPRKRR